MTAIDTVATSSWGPIYNITIQKADQVLAAADKAGHKITRVYGYNTTPDHNNKQCVDFMHYGNTAMRVWLENYLINNAARLGIEGIISNRQVMGFPSNGPMYRGPERTWRPYSGPSPHTDHVHVQFNTAAIKQTAPVRKPQPAKAAEWHGKLRLTKKTTAFNKAGKKVRTYKAGKTFTGYVDNHQFNDGRYFRVFKIPHRLWLPLDENNFEHLDGTPVRKG